MPGQDRTGPEGRGPLTGRRLGRCGSGKETNEEYTTADSAPGLGLGLGRRGGRGGANGAGRGVGRGGGKGNGGRGRGRMG